MGCWGGAALLGIPYRNRCLHAWRNPKKLLRCENCPWDIAEIEASVGLMKYTRELWAEGQSGSALIRCILARC